MGKLSRLGIYVGESGRPADRVLAVVYQVAVILTKMSSTRLAADRAWVTRGISAGDIGAKCALVCRVEERRCSGCD